jgi:hypothetical protein
MKKILFALLLLIAPAAAQLSTTPTAVEVPNLDFFHRGTFGTFVHLQGNARPGDAGLGYFYRTGMTCIPDDVQIVKDFSANCFQRVPSTAPPTLQFFGAYGDGIAITSTSVTASGTTVTVNDGAAFFSRGDVDNKNPKVITITGAGSGGATYKGVITGWSNNGGISVFPAIGTALVAHGADITYLHDDSSALTAALAWASISQGAINEDQAFRSGGQIDCPVGIYGVSGTFHHLSNVKFQGYGASPFNQSGTTNSTMPSGMVSSVGRPAAACVLEQLSTSKDDIVLDTANAWAVPINGDSGTVAAGAAGTITLRGGASAVDNFYNGGFVQINAGCAAAGQIRNIGSYVGATKVATVTWNWSVIPTNACTYAFASHAVGDQFTGTFAPFNSLAFYGQGNKPSLNNTVNASVDNVTFYSPFGNYAAIRRIGTVGGGYKHIGAYGFRVGIERISDAYSTNEDVQTRTYNFGVLASTDDHVVCTNCRNDGYASQTYLPEDFWLSSYMCALNFDPYCGVPRGEYHYYDNADRYLGPQNEGWPISADIFQLFGDVWLGSHSEYWNTPYHAYGFYGGQMSFVGGDVCDTRVSGSPAFTGNALNLTLIGVGNPQCPTGKLIDPAITTYGSNIKITNSAPLSADAAPVAGSLIDWDAFYSTHYSPLSGDPCAPGSRIVNDNAFLYICKSSGAWTRSPLTSGY